MEWWRDARYGMFIHWGLYSVLGGEWEGRDYGKEMGDASAEWIMNRAKIPREEYAKLADQFNPNQFNAAEWVSAAKDAGMKYMVITAKHHEGFSLFDTEYGSYDIMEASPFKRDIIKELADECAKQDLRFGVYYSHQIDWYHKGKGSPMSGNDYFEMVKGHVTELLTNYGDIAVLWFDLGSRNTRKMNELGKLVRELSPETVICGRLYNRKVPAEKAEYADFVSLGDRTLSEGRAENDSETCMTMRLNWGYDRDDDHWKSPQQIIQQLTVSAARNVNFLLNVGPTPEGTLVSEEIERLKTVGQWMQVNGESIYGTTPTPVDFDFPWGTMTQKGNKLYLHVMNWDPEGLSFHGIMGAPETARFLANGQSQGLSIRHDPKGNLTKLNLPADPLDPFNTVIVLEYADSIHVDPQAKGSYQFSPIGGLQHVAEDGPN